MSNKPVVLRALDLKINREKQNNRKQITNSLDSTSVDIATKTHTVATMRLPQCAGHSHYSVSVPFAQGTLQELMWLHIHHVFKSACRESIQNAHYHSTSMCRPLAIGLFVLL